MTENLSLPFIHSLSFYALFYVVIFYCCSTAWKMTILYYFKGAKNLFNNLFWALMWLKFIQSALYWRLWQTKKSQINTKESPPKWNHVWSNRDYYMTYTFFSLHLTHPSCVNTELSLISFWSCLFSCTSWASSLLRDVSNFLMF